MKEINPTDNQRKIFKLWIAFRYATVVVVGMAAGTIVFLPTRSGGVIGGHGQYITHQFKTGWPYIYSTYQYQEIQWGNSKGPLNEVREFDPFFAAIDYCVFLGLVAYTLYVARYVLPKLIQKTFSLSAVFVTMTVLAVQLLYYLPQIRIKRIDIFIAVISGTRIGNYQLLNVFPLWVYWPILYGLSCCVIVLCIMLARMTRNTLALFARDPAHIP